MKLNKATIKDLENKQPTLSYLLDNDLAKIGVMYELLENLENSSDICIFDELSSFLNNNGYFMVFGEDCLTDVLNDLDDRYNNKSHLNHLKENILNQSEEKQIEIFKKYKRNQQVLISQLLEALSRLDKDLVKEELKYYDFF